MKVLIRCDDAHDSMALAMVTKEISPSPVFLRNFSLQLGLPLTHF